MWCKKQGKYLANADVVMSVAADLYSAGLAQGWTSYAYKGGSGYSLITNGSAYDVGTCQALYYNYSAGQSNAYMGYADRTATFVAICWNNGTYYY